MTYVRVGAKQQLYAHHAMEAIHLPMEDNAKSLIENIINSIL